MRLPQVAGGNRQIIIGIGDQASGGSSIEEYSCTDFHLVLTDLNYTEAPILYHNCGTKDGAGYQGLVPPTGGGDYEVHNAKSCLRSSIMAGDFSDCSRYFPNEWMTFQIHVKAGRDYSPFAESVGAAPANPNSRSYHRDSTVELWMARENQPSKLVISMTDFDLVQHDTGTSASQPWTWWGLNGGNVGTHPGTAPRYGKLWLLPYDTGRATSVSYAPATTWYDDLIVAKRRLPDSGVASPNPPDNLSVTNDGTQNTLSWRDNSDVTGSTPATGFTVERCAGYKYLDCYANPANFVQIATLGAVTAYQDRSSASARTIYTYRVKAFNGNGSSAYSNAAMNVTGPVGDVTATDVDSTSISISWTQSGTPPAGAGSGYQVERCTGAYTACGMSDGNCGCGLHCATPGTFSCTDTGLNPGTTYTYRVKAFNAAGSDRASNIESWYSTTSYGGAATISQATTAP